jgi:hypothetical protein
MAMVDEDIELHVGRAPNRVSKLGKNNNNESYLKTDKEDREEIHTRQLSEKYFQILSFQDRIQAFHIWQIMLQITKSA